MTNYKRFKLFLIDLIVITLLDLFSDLFDDLRRYFTDLTPINQADSYHFLAKVKLLNSHQTKEKERNARSLSTTVDKAAFNLINTVTTFSNNIIDSH